MNNRVNKAIILIRILVIGIIFCGYSLFPEEALSWQPDSPFGFHDPFGSKNDAEYFADIGAKFARQGFVWEQIEDSEGNYNWESLDEYVNLCNKVNAALLAGVGAVNKSDNEKCRRKNDLCSRKKRCTPCDMGHYFRFFAALINRYKDTVKFWQIGNELNHSWGESPERYADFVKINYDLLKQNCPDCKLVLGGVSSRPSGYYKFYKRVIERAGQIKKQGKGDTFDVFAFHWAGWYGSYKTLNDFSDNRDYNFKEYVEDIKNDLNTNNINAEIWITEMSTYSGDPVDERVSNPPQSEKQQAVELVKRYVYPLSAGIRKIFWVKITEWHNFARKGINRFYDNTGLVNNPAFDGDSSKKLAYYTFKKMTGVLEGSDWDNIQTVREEGGIYIYKFTRNKKPVWVAWNDNLEEKQVTISGITSTQVNPSTTLRIDGERSRTIKITEAIPKYESGKQVTNYLNAFNSEVKQANNGKIILALKEIPVFIEE